MQTNLFKPRSPIEQREVYVSRVQPKHIVVRSRDKSEKLLHQKEHNGVIRVAWNGTDIGVSTREPSYHVEALFFVKLRMAMLGVRAPGGDRISEIDKMARSRNHRYAKVFHVRYGRFSVRNTS